MMATTAIRKFTDEGIEQFRDYLVDLRGGATSCPPFELLNDPATSEHIDSGGEIENRNFKTRLELAQYLDEVLSEIEIESLETDVHLWSWLSLFYFDQVCPSHKGDVRKPGRDYRHILEPGYPNGHRHLIAGVYLVYTIYELGEDLSRLLLWTPLHKESIFHHQLTVRQTIITNRGILDAAHQMYFDKTRGIPKKGPHGKKGSPGTLLRYIDVIQQLDLNYDLYSMTGDQILELLPPEFSKWQ
jgi:hypothetical protein